MNMDQDLARTKTDNGCFFKIIYPYLVTRNEPVSLPLLLNYLRKKGFNFVENNLHRLLKSYKSHVEVREDMKLECVVEAITLIAFCKNFNGKRNCPTEECNMLHICRHFVKGKCNFGRKCNKPHTFSDPHTKQVLVEFSLADLGEEVLRAFLCRHVQYCLDEHETELPKQLEICHYYNVAPGCSRGNDCPYLHICKFYAQQGLCKFSKQCMRSHSLSSPYSQMILKRYGYSEESALRRFQLDFLNEQQSNDKMNSDQNPALSPTRSANSPKKEKQNDKALSTLHRGFVPSAPCPLKVWNRKNLAAKIPALDPFSGLLPFHTGHWLFDHRSYLSGEKGFDYFQCTRANPWLQWAHPSIEPYDLKEFASDWGVYSTSYQVKQAKGVPQSLSSPQEREEICLPYLANPTLKHACSKMHTTEVFCWRVNNPQDQNNNGWYDLTSEANLELEAEYCNVNKDVGTVMNHEEKLWVRFEENLDANDSKKSRNVIRFAGHKMDQGVRVPLLFKRISTKSRTSEARGEFDTVWKWYYWRDEGNWVSYDDSFEQSRIEASKSRISSLDIEKNIDQSGVQSLFFPADSCVIMLEQMTEINIKMNIARKLRRRPLYLPMTCRKEESRTDEKKAPSRHSWPDLRVWGKHHQTEPAAFHRIELPMSSKFYGVIESKFRCSLPDYALIKVESVQHMDLLTAYKNKKEEMTKDLRQEPREKFLYHTLDNEEHIFSISHSTKALPDGQVIYFARDPKLAHDRGKKTGNSVHRIVIFRVIIPPATSGAGSTVFSQLPVTDMTSFEALFSSYRNDPPLYALCDGSHSYPEYIVTYGFKHTNDMSFSFL